MEFLYAVRVLVFNHYSVGDFKGVYINVMAHSECGISLQHSRNSKRHHTRLYLIRHRLTSQFARWILIEASILKNTAINGVFFVRWSRYD